jgi:hypothetical protein
MKSIYRHSRLPAVLAALAAWAAPARADDLESKLLQQATHVLRYARDKGWHNLGVLKFQVRKGAAEPTDNAGTLNLSLARRLEVALVLANDVRNPVGIVRNASAVAARLKDANHLTDGGRSALFDGKYPLAWGDREVSPDAFVTGIVAVKEDLRTLKVALLAFDKIGDKLEKVAQFAAGMDAGSLAETGESYLLRDGFEGGKVELVQANAVEVAARVKGKEKKFPLGDAAAPVSLEVRYDGKPVTVEVRDGRAWVREPQQGQKVSFVLTHRKTTKETYGIVFKVNGENTLYRQRAKDVRCTPWVLDSEDPPIEIEGYQKDGKKHEEFRVLSRAESKAREMNYGADVGTITLTVFRAGTGRAAPAVGLTDEAEDLAVLNRGLFPDKTPRNLAALRQQLRKDVERGGLIAEGETKPGEVVKVKFTPDPVAVMTATITYYKP